MSDPQAPDAPRRHGRVLLDGPASDGTQRSAEPADRGDASASVDGDGSGPESSDAGTRRRRGPIFFIALGVAVVLAVFVGVLATREPSQDRRADSPLVGEVAPPVQGMSLTTGEPFDLDSLRGQWVVVNFFATWCVPCRVEHPELLSFSRRHQQIGDASVVSVVFDDDPGEVQQYFEDNDSTWPVIDGSGTGVILDYAVAAVPESFIISPTGYVVAKVTGGVTSVGLDQLIEQLSGAPADGTDRSGASGSSSSGSGSSATTGAGSPGTTPP